MTEPSVTTVGHYPKARWWAAVGIVSVVLGVAASTIWFVWALGRVDDGVDDLVLVGGADGAELTVTEAVDWTIYLVPSDRTLSGIRFEVVDTASGDFVTLTPARNDVDYSVGDRTGRPVARAELEPGTYRVEVEPDDATLAIGDDVGERVQRMWLVAVLIGIPTVLGGGIVAAVNLLRAVRSAPSSDPTATDTDAETDAPQPPDPPPSSRPQREAPPSAGSPPSQTPPPSSPPPSQAPPTAGPPPVAHPAGPPPLPPPPVPSQPPPPDPRQRRDR